jgi:hypothetical protein
MSPMAAISEWLSQQDVDIQHEIARYTLMLIQDYSDLGDFAVKEDDELLADLFEWLKDSNTWKVRALGKAITFRTCFEHVFSNKFTPELWAESKRFMLSVASEGASDSESDAAKVAPSAFRELKNIPERQKQWIAIGKSWTALADEHLTRDALASWSA